MVHISTAIWQVFDNLRYFLSTSWRWQLFLSTGYFRKTLYLTAGQNEIRSFSGLV